MARKIQESNAEFLWWVRALGTVFSGSFPDRLSGVAVLFWQNVYSCSSFHCCCALQTGKTARYVVHKCWSVCIWHHSGIHVWLLQLRDCPLSPCYGKKGAHWLFYVPFRSPSQENPFFFFLFPLLLHYSKAPSVALISAEQGESECSWTTALFLFELIESICMKQCLVPPPSQPLLDW